MGDRYQLHIRPEADAEVAEHARWYEQRERGLGREFLRAFRSATDVLRRDPYLYQIVTGEARRILMRRFPYGIFYEVDDPHVVVLACFHESQDPQRWQERLTPGT